MALFLRIQKHPINSSYAAWSTYVQLGAAATASHVAVVALNWPPVQVDETY
jgi:hypothetical protein